MNSRDRAFMFVVCIIIRSILVYLVYAFPELSQRFSLLATIPVVTWLYIYFVSGKPVGFAGGPAWWSELRIIHAALWAVYVLYSYRKLSYAWIPLFADVVVGITGKLVISA